MAGPFDFTGQDIENTYQRVLQTDGTLIYDGTGSLVNTLNVTASFATTASYAEYAVSASHEITHETSSSYAETASIAFTALTASFVTGSIFTSTNPALSASYAQTASFVQNAQTASYVENAQTASFVQNAQTASFVLNALSSSFSSTASFVQNAQTASFVTLAQTASYVENAQTASFVLNAISSSFASTASFVQNAQTASFVNTLNQSVTITGAITASSNISASGYLVAQNITASGNISASGNIYANEFYADLGINEGYHIGSGKPALSITDGGTLNLGAAHPTYIAAGVNIYTTGSDSSKGLFLDSTGNITASGNISASGLSHTLGGDVTIGDDLSIGGGRHSFDSHGSNTLTILSGSSHTLMHFASDGATTITGNITASGNISASGTIQSLDMRVGTSEQPNGIIRFGDPGGKEYPQFIQSEINQLKLERGNGETLVKYNTGQHEDGPKVVIYGDISSSLNDASHVLGGQLSLMGTTNGSIHLYAGGTLRTSLNAKGNVNSYINAGVPTNLGIGTITPTAKLHVVGSTLISGSLTVTGNATQREELSNTLYAFTGQAEDYAGAIDDSCVAGQLVFLDPAGAWYTVGQTTAASTKLLGLWNGDNMILLEGTMVVDTIQSPTPGLPVYIRDGAPFGEMSTNIPTGGYVRVVGHCLYENVATPGQWIIRFKPSNDWYEI
jgi:hypothetical protein